VPVPPITKGTVAEVVIVGVIIVGLVDNTAAIVPVERVTPVPPLATAIGVDKSDVARVFGILV